MPEPRPALLSKSSLLHKKHADPVNHSAFAQMDSFACFYHLAQKQGKALYKSRLISNRSRTVETVLHRYSFCLAGIIS